MKTVIITIYLLSLLIITTSTYADDFNLTGNEHLDITTSYQNGYLYNFSTANVLTGGYIYNAFINNDAVLDISGGIVSKLDVHNNSIVNISSGTVGGKNILTHDNSTINISGGNIENILSVRDNSQANISGGNVKYLITGELRLNTPQRITITNGIVEEMGTWITLEESQNLNYKADFSPADLACYGVQAAPGTVASLNTTFNIQDSSNLFISGGNMNLLKAEDSSTMNLYKGSIGSIYAYGSSTINLSGGNVNNLHVAENSTIIFDGYDFILGQGLSWDIDGQTILGTGTLTGNWFDGTSFVIPIYKNNTTATIIAIPEPATLLLLTLGTLTIIKKLITNQPH